MLDTIKQIRKKLIAFYLIGEENWKERKSNLRVATRKAAKRVNQNQQKSEL